MNRFGRRQQLRRYHEWIAPIRSRRIGSEALVYRSSPGAASLILTPNPGSSPAWSSTAVKERLREMRFLPNASRESPADSTVFEVETNGNWIHLPSGTTILGVASSFIRRDESLRFLQRSECSFSVSYRSLEHIDAPVTITLKPSDRDVLEKSNSSVDAVLQVNPGAEITGADRGSMAGFR